MTKERQGAWLNITYACACSFFFIFPFRSIISYFMLGCNPLKTTIRRSRPCLLAIAQFLLFYGSSTIPQRPNIFIFYSILTHTPPPSLQSNPWTDGGDDLSGVIISYGWICYNIKKIQKKKDQTSRLSLEYPSGIVWNSEGIAEGFSCIIVFFTG